MLWRCAVFLQAARARIVIGDPSYFPAEKYRRVGQVIRSICILDHPVPAIGGVPSGQIILPQNQTGRKNDIYVSIVSDVHEVTPKGKTVAIVSTNVETANPKAEVAPGIALLGPILLRYAAFLGCFPASRTPPLLLNRDGAATSAVPCCARGRVVCALLRVLVAFPGCFVFARLLPPSSAPAFTEH